MIPSKPQSQHQQGFTLIELMIVIAIIGILAAIALPMYQDYVSKAQVTRVYYEVSSSKVAIEHILSNGNLPTLNPQESDKVSNGVLKEYIGLNESAPNSSLIYTASLDVDEATKTFNSISATLGKNAYIGIQGSVIKLSRQADGLWTCVVTGQGKGWKEKFVPTGCTSKSA